MAHVRDEFLIFGSPLIGEEEIAEVVDSLRSGWIGSGPKVRRFEELLRDQVGAPYVRCVSSCTAALFLALKAMGVGEGDEVLVPAMTFVATANAVEQTGAAAVLVDVEQDTGLIDLEAAKAALTDRTRGVIPVHLYGRPVDMDRLLAFSSEHEVFVLEDAAHALGASWKGTPIGGHGNPTAFSFYPTKNITTIEGGALATFDVRLARRIEQLALHGLSAGAWARFSDSGYKHYLATELGYKFNMTDVQASVGIHQLPRLSQWIARRAELAARYDELLSGMPLTTPPAASPEMVHAHHLYPVLLEGVTVDERDAVLNSLTRHKIGVGVHYTAVHLHPIYREKYGYVPNDFPVATDISNRTLSLPLSPKIGERDQDDVAEALHQALAELRQR